MNENKHPGILSFNLRKLVTKKKTCDQKKHRLEDIFIYWIKNQNGIELLYGKLEDNGVCLQNSNGELFPTKSFTKIINNM